MKKNLLIAATVTIGFASCTPIQGPVASRGRSSNPPPTYGRHGGPQTEEEAMVARGTSFMDSMTRFADSVGRFGDRIRR